MKKYTVASLAFVLVILGCTRPSTSPNTETSVPAINRPENWKYLDGPEYEISYPPNWSADQSGVSGTSFILFGRNPNEGKFRENINLIIQDLKGLNFDLDRYAELSERQVRTLVNNLKFIESKRVKLNDDEFHLVVYEGDQGQFQLKWKQYCWVEKDRAFILTFTSTRETYDLFINSADSILNSFKVKDI
jgi:hypothetical protein